MMMTTLLLKASRKEQRSFIRFIWSKGLSPNAIHSEMRPVCCNKCFTRPLKHAWCKTFAHGRESVSEQEQPVRSQHRFFASDIQKLVDALHGSNVQMNLDDVLKNKTIFSSDI